MATKMKGLFKGLRYISQIFEEDKEQEIQIGFPTDVKHVAHIGWDGPSAADSSPSWMKEFKSTTGYQSAPLDSNGNNIEDPEIKWVSEDSKKGNRATTDSPGRDLPEVPRSSRRHNSSDNNNSNDSPRKKDSSTKSRQSRRNNSKDSSEGSVNKSTRELGQQSDSPSRAHPDLGKKSRRKKSKDTDGGGSTRSRSKDTDGGGSTRSRSKDTDGGGSTRSRPRDTDGGGSTRSRAKDTDGEGSTRSRSKDSDGGGSSRSRSKPAPCGGACAYSDPGLDTGSVLRTPGSPLGPISSMHGEEKERGVIS